MSDRTDFNRARETAAALGLTLVSDACGYFLAPATDATRVGATWHRFDALRGVSDFLRGYSARGIA